MAPFFFSGEEMSTIYLQAVNSLLLETNEVLLSSATFSSAVGIQAFVKDCVNRAYLSICSYKKTWPFLSYHNSNEFDPFAGNISIPLVKGQRWYLLKPGSTSVASDFSEVDWNSFFITNEGMPGVTGDFVFVPTRFMSFDTWFKYRSQNEARDASGEQNYGIPKFVIPSRDGRFVGVSSLPDQPLTMYFNAWVQPVSLVNYDDTLLVPDKYLPVVLDKARYYIHQFKENEIQANLARADYIQGIQKMSLDLIGEKIKDFTDDRVRF